MLCDLYKYSTILNFTLESKPRVQVWPSSNVHAHHLQGAPTTKGILDLLQILWVQIAHQNLYDYFEFTIMFP